MNCNIGYERGKLNDLIDFATKHEATISKIIDRLIDLMISFQKR